MRSAIHDYLYTDTAAGAVVAHGSWLFRLNGILNQVLPASFQGAVRLANIKSGKVILLAENGAVAAKLRQMTLRLQTTLRAAGVECNGVEVKVQPLEMSSESKGSVVKPLSGTSCGHLGDLARNLPEDSPLRAAIEQLLARAAKG